MKFTCDSCQARYQIPDEKVAGRRLRYTCRKCSHAIVLDGTSIVLDVGTFDVSPSTAEPNETLAPTSIAPSAFPPSGSILGGAASSPTMPKAAPIPKPISVPRPIAPPVRASVPPPKASVPPPKASVPPPKASVPPARVSVAPPKAFVPHVDATVPPARASVPPPLPPVEEEPPKVALAPSLPELPIWHVAIRGTPVGPLRGSEVAARAEAGDVTRRSLAWSEGQTDWLPIAEIPELAALVPASDAAAPIVPAVVTASSSAPSSESTESRISGGDARPEASTAPAFGIAVEAFPAADWTPREKYESKLPLLIGLFGFAVVVTGIALYLGYGSTTESTTEQGLSANAARVDATAGSASPSDPNTLSNSAIEDVGDDSYLAELAGVADAGIRPRAEARNEPARDDRPLPMPTSAGTTTGTPRTDGAGDAFETHVTTTPRPAATGPLDAAQISAVVRANRSRAQRCYERAATMSGSAPDVRLSVTIRIATSGVVSNVDIQGNDFGGVITCVQRIVSSWQFPASTTGGQTTFSLVFAGG